MDFRLNPMISAACAAVKRLFTIDGSCFSIKNMDEESSGHTVEKQLKCAYQAALTWAVFAARNVILGIAAINVISLIKKYAIIKFLTMTIKEGFNNLI